MTNFTCTAENCRVESTGECLEGLELADCSTCKVEGAVQEDEIASSLEVSEAPDVSETPDVVEKAPWVEQHSGKLLLFSDLGALSLADFPRLVMLVGPPDCGKTTLITSVYDAFQEGGLDWSFRRSLTLPALEQLSFLNRIESGRGTPTTEHTQRTQEAEFAHFTCASRADAGSCRELFLMNLSGEDSDDLWHREDAAASMPYLKRVDHIAILVDGARLASEAHKWAAETVAAHVIKRLVESQVSAEAEVCVVVSKFDELESADKSESAIRWADEMATRLVALAGERFRSAFTMRLAARPVKGTRTEPLNLGPLVDRWLDRGLPLDGGGQ